MLAFFGFLQFLLPVGEKMRDFVMLPNMMLE